MPSRDIIMMRAKDGEAGDDGIRGVEAATRFK